MNCLHPKAPNEDDLLKFAFDDEALSEEGREHVEQCATCQQRIRDYKRVNSFLLSHLYRRQCPDGTRLTLYCANDLPTDEQLVIAAHLKQCPLCAAEAADTRRFLAAMNPFPALQVPLVQAVHRIIASLVPQSMQLVTRNDAPQSGWPRKYSAGGADLLLDLSHASHDEHILLGIVTSTENMQDFEGAQVELYPEEQSHTNNGSGRGTKPPLSTLIDDLENFVVSNVPAGQYTLIVHLPGSDIVVESLQIGMGGSG